MSTSGRTGSRAPSPSRAPSTRVVAVLGLVPVVALVAGGMRTWVTGSVDDPVLGSSTVTGTGTQVAPGLVALALAAGAAVIAMLTTGRVARRLTAILLGLVGAGVVALCTRVLLDPAGVLGGLAAQGAGRTGSIETTAHLTTWPWLGAASGVLVVSAAVLGWLGASRWAGLGSRYDSPVGRERGAAGARGERTSSDWDRLSRGEDPTDAPPRP